MTRMNQRMLSCALVAGLGLAAPVAADIIEQEGSLSGNPGESWHAIVFDQFDDLGGTRQLNSVTLDALTSVIGGYQTDGSGQAVEIFAQLSADYYLSGGLLAETEATISAIVQNNNQAAATVFDTDTDQAFISDALDLTAWIGTGDITLDALVSFESWETPPGIINFGAGGSVYYTVTYEYSLVPAPGVLALLLVGGLAGRRRRRGSAQ